MKKWLYLTGYAVVWWLLLSRIMPDFIQYDKTRTFGWVIFILIFIGLPYTLNLILREFNLRYELMLIFVSSSIFLGVVYGIVVDKLEDKELRENGLIAKGIVYKRWRSRGKWLIRAQYYINGKRYETFTETDHRNSFFEKDTVTIIYSTLKPDLSLIKELNE